jgi:hypothetical protein
LAINPGRPEVFALAEAAVVILDHVLSGGHKGVLQQVVCRHTLQCHFGHNAKRAQSETRKMEEARIRVGRA